MDTTKNFREWLLALAVSLGIALLVVAPFFWLGNASGHDFEFHAASWLDVAGQWRERIIYPRWMEWANHGFGEPRFVFYPPLSWMLGAALSFVVPWKFVPAVFISLVQTLAGLCSFAFVRRFLSGNAALIGAACYAANPYALLVVYMRSDFAELLACALLPVVMLTALQLCGLVENRRHSLPRALAFFAIVFAAVWLSNVPAGVMTAYSVALVFAWAAIEEKSLQPLWRGAAGFVLGFGLTGFYLLPAAYEQRWVNIAQVLSKGLLPSQSFLYTQMDDPEHNLFNWIASSAAVLLIVMTGIAAVAVHQKGIQAQENSEARKLWRVLILLSAAAAVLMLRPSSIFWQYLPKLRFVQFPWRWMAIVAVPYAYFLAAVITRRRSGWIWGAAVFVVIGGTATFLVQNAWWDTEDFPALQEAIANGRGFDGADEYDPSGDDHYNLPERAPRLQILPADDPEGAAPAAEIHIERWSPEERDFRVSSRQPLRLAPRLLDYPAWRVEVNGQAVTPQHADDYAQMILPLSLGKQRITLKFVRTQDRTLGMAVTLMAVLTLLALLLRKPSRKKTTTRCAPMPESRHSRGRAASIAACRCATVAMRGCATPPIIGRG